MKIQIRNHPINYESYGEGKPIIMLPGWTMSAQALAHLNEPIFTDRQGWKRIYIDPPGHGATPGADWISTLDDFLELILETVDSLIGAQRFALFGYSLGAYLARGILYYRQEKVLGISMLAPAIVTNSLERNVPAHTVIVEEPGIMDTLHTDEKDMFEMVVVRTTDFLNDMRNFPQPQVGAGGDMNFLDTIRLDPNRYLCSFNVDELKRPFPGPTLIITGRQDTSVGYKDAWQILDNYPRGTFVVLDRAGHLMEEKFEFNRTLMKEWLDRISEYAEKIEG